MLLAVALLVVGFILLIKGADFFVEGASSLAAKMAISEIVIGLTIVAFGTSSPELVVNVVASFQNNPDITFGNVVGSNIVNILLILGITGIIYPVTTQKNTVWKEIPFAFLAAIVLCVLCNDIFLAQGESDVISRSDGIILLLFFSIFLVYTFVISQVEANEGPEVADMSRGKIALFIVLGLVMLMIGGKMVVDNAVFLAQNLGVSDKLIGLTIVAIGTSLPELATSVVAALKKKNDIVVGNVVGSNIFNIFFVLATSSIIAPVPFPSSGNIDLLVLLLASAFLFFTMFTGKRKTLDRWEAVVFLVCYIAYTSYIIGQMARV